DRGQVVWAARGRECARLLRADRDRGAAAQREGGLRRRRAVGRARGGVVRARPAHVPRAAARGAHDAATGGDPGRGGCRSRGNRGGEDAVSDAPLSPDLPDPVRQALARTPARLLVGRSGPGYRTGTWLKLREDHAAARDAVHAELDLERDLGSELVTAFGLFEVSTWATSK